MSLRFSKWFKILFNYFEIYLKVRLFFIRVVFLIPFCVSSSYPSSFVFSSPSSSTWSSWELRSSFSWSIKSGLSGSHLISLSSSPENWDREKRERTQCVMCHRHFPRRKLENCHLTMCHHQFPLNWTVTRQCVTTLNWTVTLHCVITTFPWIWIVTWDVNY